MAASDVPAQDKALINSLVAQGATIPFLPASGDATLKRAPPMSVMDKAVAKLKKDHGCK